jgi:hypothetical protein
MEAHEMFEIGKLYDCEARDERPHSISYMLVI